MMHQGNNFFAEFVYTFVLTCEKRGSYTEISAFSLYNSYHSEHVICNQIALDQYRTLITQRFREHFFMKIECP